MSTEKEHLEELNKEPIEEVIVEEDHLEEKEGEIKEQSSEDEKQEEFKYSEEKLLDMSEKYNCSLETIKEALRSGWDEKEKFQKDPDLWEAPKRFLYTKSVFKKLDERNKELEDLKKSVDEWKQWTEKLSRKELEEEKARLRKEMEKAKEDKDFDTYSELKEKEKSLAPEQEASKEPDQVVDYFKTKMFSLFGEETFNSDEFTARAARIRIFTSELEDKYKDMGLTSKEMADIILEEVSEKFSKWKKDNQEESTEPAQTKKAPPPGRMPTPEESSKKPGLTRLSKKHLAQWEKLKRWYNNDEKAFIADLKSVGEIE